MGSSRGSRGWGRRVFHHIVEQMFLYQIANTTSSWYLNTTVVRTTILQPYPLLQVQFRVKKNTTQPMNPGTQVP